MLNFEKALAVARQRKDGIDNCTEYRDYYLFGASKDDGMIGPGPVAVCKADGRILPMPEFVMSDPGEPVREIDIKD